MHVQKTERRILNTQQPMTILLLTMLNRFGLAYVFLMRHRSFSQLTLPFSFETTCLDACYGIRRRIRAQNVRKYLNVISNSKSPFFRRHLF